MQQFPQSNSYLLCMIIGNLLDLLSLRWNQHTVLVSGVPFGVLSIAFRMDPICIGLFLLVILLLIFNLLWPQLCLIWILERKERILSLPKHIGYYSAKFSWQVWRSIIPFVPWYIWSCLVGMNISRMSFMSILGWFYRWDLLQRMRHRSFGYKRHASLLLETTIQYLSPMW